MRKFLLGLTLVLGSTTAAYAADQGIYIGAGVSQAKIDNVGEEFDTDALNDFELDDTAWKLVAGIRPLDFFAVEANYMDLGSESATIGPGLNLTAEANAIAAFGIGFVSLPFVDLYAKAGLAYWEVEGGLTGVTALELDGSGTEFAYGVGAQVRLGSLAARLEYEQFDIENTDGLELLTLGVIWTLL